MKNVIFKNADWIITMDGDRTRYRNCDLLVSGQEIREIGTNLEEKLKDEITIDLTIDASGKILVPGFVNTHHHTWQALFRNIKATQGLQLEPWLKVMYEIYKDLSQDVARAGVYASLGDCLKTGCTTSNDLWYPHPVGVPQLVDAEIEAAKEIGIRFHPVRAYHSVTSDIVPPEVVDTTEGFMEDAERLVKKYHDRSRFSMCQVGIGPSIAQYDTQEIIQATVDLAEKLDIMVHGHLAESKFEVEYTIEKFGCRPAEWFRRNNLLGSRFYYAHCIHLNDEDIALIAQTNTGVASCPISNMYLSSGSCRVPDLMNAGVKRIGLGVDGAASSNSSNMMEEMRCSYLLNRLSWGDNAPNPEDILYMATAGGAKALGRDDIGYLSPGMAADITMIDWKQLQYAGGNNDPVDCIVTSGDARMIDTVMVNGNIVVKHGKLTMVDEDKKRDYVNEVGKALLKKASVRIEGLKEDIE
ncbi:amidohydrolase family protein [Melaminivora alkalimesophila]|uniref:amidohydrolase family protein n=1 Tax=Melaminivora alkalimesophila TaxID=1165852 RepID=UPI00096AAF9A|nr:amidohydrolase family protein [Melaminivora alkalimesophila]